MATLKFTFSRTLGWACACEVSALAITTSESLPFTQPDLTPTVPVPTINDVEIGLGNVSRDAAEKA